jgi:hypothetical protein
VSVEWIHHKGKKILYVDYAGATTDAELLEVLDEQGKVLRESPSKSLVLSNFEGTSIGPGFMNEVKKRGQAMGDQVLERDAILGVSGLKDILLNGYISATGMRGKTRAFGSKEEALDWLVG